MLSLELGTVHCSSPHDCGASGSKSRFGSVVFRLPLWLRFCSRSARGARAELHAPKAPKSKAEMEAEAAAEELMAKHREVKTGHAENGRGSTESPSFFFPLAQ